MHYTGFYDQILNEIEGGNAGSAVNRLVGMLDVTNLQPRAMDQACTELGAHPLTSLLFQDPAMADAARNPNEPAGRLQMLMSKTLGSEISSTGRMLFEASSELSIMRALRGRQSGAESKLARAWQTGGRICLLDRAMAGISSILAGRDQSNVTIIGDYGGGEICANYPTGAPFDLILAPDISDHCSAAALKTAIGAMRQSLSARGKIILATLVPQHPGTGWCRACLHWNPHCHSAETVAAIATSEGMAALTYQDAANCVNWAELTTADDRDTGGKSDEY